MDAKPGICNRTRHAATETKRLGITQRQCGIVRCRLKNDRRIKGTLTRKYNCHNDGDDCCYNYQLNERESRSERYTMFG